MDSAVAVLRRRAETVAEAIGRRAPAGSVVVVFAGGSVARGNVWSAEVDGRLEIYSDIDLYVVAKDAASVPAIGAAARAAVAELPAQEGGALFVRAVDVGIYTPADLRAQPVRPGTADLAARHLPLCGDSGVIASLLPPVPPRMDPLEALYLLENRAWDALDAAGDSPVAARVQRVLSLKIDLDIAAAHLIVAGATPAAASDPGAALAALVERAGPEIEPAVSAAARRACALRADPRAIADAGVAPGSGEALARVCGAWCDLARRVLHLPGRDAESLVAARCAGRSAVANLRELVRAARRLKRPAGAAIASGIGCIACSPRATLRVHALARGIERSGLAARGTMDAHVARARRVAAALGFRSGSIDERVRAAQRAVS